MTRQRAGSEVSDLLIMRGFFRAIGILPDKRQTDLSDELLEGKVDHVTRETELERVGYKFALLLRKHMAAQTQFVYKDDTGTPIARWPLVGPQFMAHLSGAANAPMGRSFTGDWSQMLQWATQSAGGLMGGLGGEIIGGVIGGAIAGPAGVVIGEGLGGAIGANMGVDGAGGYLGGSATGGTPPYAPAAPSGGFVAPGQPMPGGGSSGGDTVLDGAMAGAATGAALGSVVPGVGTVLGAAGGAVLGAVADYLNE